MMELIDSSYLLAVICKSQGLSFTYQKDGKNVSSWLNIKKNISIVMGMKWWVVSVLKLSTLSYTSTSCSFDIFVRIFIYYHELKITLNKNLVNFANNDIMWSRNKYLLTNMHLNAFGSSHLFVLIC